MSCCQRSTAQNHTGSPFVREGVFPTLSGPWTCSSWGSRLPAMSHLLSLSREFKSQMQPQPRPCCNGHSEAVATAHGTENRGRGVKWGRTSPVQPGIRAYWPAVSKLPGQCLVTQVTVFPNSKLISAFIKWGLASSDFSGSIKFARVPPAMNRRGGGMKEALCGASALERGHPPPWSPSPSGPQQLPLYTLPWPSKEALLAPGTTPQYFLL